MGKQWTRQQWEAKVTEMLQEEPDVTREERAMIVEYLSANFKPGGKIYVNRAKAADLETAFEIPTKSAEAIVRYREEKGDFKSLDDLKKVPNVDVMRIEARKDRRRQSRVGPRWTFLLSSESARVSFNTHAFFKPFDRHAACTGTGATFEPVGNRHQAGHRHTALQGNCASSDGWNAKQGL
jgi:competence ComEA-like helix-hairpin-helix protein